MDRTAERGKGGRDMIYKVWVCLEAEYDDIEADSEEEAFQIASDAAMSGASWDFQIEEITKDEELSHED